MKLGGKAGVEGFTTKVYSREFIRATANTKTDDLHTIPDGENWGAHGRALYAVASGKKTEIDKGRRIKDARNMG